MANRFKFTLMLISVALFASWLTFAQSKAQQPAANEHKSAADSGHSSEAAPRHDISGTWEPANGPQDGVQADGVKAMPNDGKPQHQLPYTPY